MSIVVMKRKAEAQRGISRGASFSLNGTHTCGDGSSKTSVGSAWSARQNVYNTRVRFNGRNDLIAERVWTGSKMPDSMGGGEAETQTEYIERRRMASTKCMNLLFNDSHIGNLFQIDSFASGITFNGTLYPVNWYKGESYITTLVGRSFAINTLGERGLRTMTATGYIFTNDTAFRTTYSTYALLTETYTAPTVPLADSVYNANITKALGDTNYIKISYLTNTGVYAVLEPAVLAVPAADQHIYGIKLTYNGIEYIYTAFAITFQNPELTQFPVASCKHEPATYPGSVGGCGSNASRINGCPVTTSRGKNGASGGGGVGRHARVPGGCSINIVNKDPAFDAKGYSAGGGYLDQIKIPHTDALYCGPK